MRRLLRFTIAAPVEAVWHALTDPDVVAGWTGLQPVRLHADYPIEGEHALWRDPRTGTLLHDEILAVEPNRRLYSRLRVGSALAVEDYLLRPIGNRATQLRATWQGHPALVDGNDAAMQRMIRAVRARVRSRHGTQSGST